MVEEFTAPLVGRLMMRLAGFPEADAHRWRRWIQDMIRSGFSFSNTNDRGTGFEQCYPDLLDYLDRHIDDRTRSSGRRNDALSRVVTAHIEGRPLPRTLQRMILFSIPSAGGNTMGNFVNNTLLSLATEPQLVKSLRRDRMLVPRAVEESLRRDSPSMFISRICREPAEVGETPVADGEKVLLGLASANRDESVYGDPHAFRLDRVGQPPHVAFGWGSHTCAGVHVVRHMGARELLRDGADHEYLRLHARRIEELRNAVEPCDLAATARRTGLDRADLEGLLRAVRQLWHRGHGGVPLLLVHGWPSTRRIWARNIVDLAARGFEVIAPDLRGFGDSDCGADGLHDVVAHSLDMAALLHDRLELEKVVAAGGDLGAAAVQDLSLRFPGLVDRLVVFNGPLPSVPDRTAHLPRDERRFEDSHGFRPATEPDALLAELATPQARMEYVAGHYRSWSPPGAFNENDLAYLAEPFADARKLRASFGTYESLIDPGQRTGRSMIAANDTPALILVALADPCCYPAFGQRAAIVFARHTGPFGILDTDTFRSGKRQRS